MKEYIPISREVMAERLEKAMAEERIRFNEYLKKKDKLAAERRIQQKLLKQQKQNN